MGGWWFEISGFPGNSLVMGGHSGQNHPKIAQNDPQKGDFQVIHAFLGVIVCGGVVVLAGAKL